MKDEVFAVIGGDMRQVYLARGLADKGFGVRVCGLELCKKPIPGTVMCESLSQTLCGVKYVILPLPCCADGEYINTPLSKERFLIEDFKTNIDCNMTVFGGQIPRDLFADTRAVTVDYFDREETQILNAVPTAEGAIYTAIGNYPGTVDGSRCLVIGFGRIGKVLAAKLRLLNADVTVSARKAEDIAWIKAYGYTAARTAEIAQIIPSFDMVFNTVPAPTVHGDVLKKADKDTLFVELASKPGGIDFSCAEALCLNAVRASALPGKFSPKTAGNIIMNTVLDSIGQNG